jgi:small subunit ribosomal protein S3
LGIKVWICKGEVYGKRDLSPNIGLSSGSQGGQASGSKKPAAGPRRKKK